MVRTADAAEPPASDLLAAMVAEIESLYERLDGSLDSAPATPEQMRAPHGAFLVLDAGQTAIACGGLKRLDAETAEIKRMYVAPGWRGSGVGGALLEALEGRAAELGYRRVRLDTGADQPAAKRLYERSGYRGIDDYNANPYAAYWFEKDLAPTSA